MKFDVFIRANSQARTEDTIRLYLREAKRFQGWLGTRPLTLEAVQEYEAWLRSKFRQNSLSNKVIGVNLYLKWKGLDARIRRPPKEIAANPKLVTDKEYRAILERIEDAEERLVVRLLHDTGMRPSDIVSLRLADIANEDDVVLLRRRTQKTGTIAESILSRETAAELHDYIEKSGVTDHIFRGETDKPHRHRTWPNAVLRKHHAEGITPRTFRRTLATNWGDDLRSLMSQAGWSDPKTILLHYRRDVLARHVREAEKVIGPVRDADDESDLPGYG
ncbi:MAG TPA: site-specific integrase [Thermoplasmata archaeon]